MDKKKRKPQNTKKVIVKLLQYMARYRLRLVLVFVCMILSSVCTVRATYYLKPCINDYAIPLIGQKDPDLSGFIGVIALMAALYFAAVAASFVQNAVMVVISNDIMYRIRNEMFDNMEHYPLRYFDTHKNGQIMSYYSNDVEAMSDMLRKGFPKIVEGITTCVSILVTIFLADLQLALIVAACVLSLSMLLRKITEHNAAFFVDQQKGMAKLNAYTEEMVSGHTEIIAFGREKAVMEAFTDINERLFGSSRRAEFFSNILFDVTRGLTYVGYTIIAASGCYLAILGRTDVGTLGVFLQYYKQMISPITSISKQVNNLFSTLAGAERIFDFLDEAKETDEGSVTLVNCIMHGTKMHGTDDSGSSVLQETDKFTGSFAWKDPQGILTPCRGHIVFSHVDFGYTEKKQVLYDFNLEIESGQTVAFVGPTGAGKTTIINLLGRFYEIRTGEIYFDGINIMDIRKESLRRAAGMVLQDTHLFSLPVSDNIRFGRPGAGGEEIVAAAELANADYFIRHLSENYDTVLANGGSALSQGERQLLAIARAAVGRFPVLVMDEATSSLDSRTEHLATEGMKNLMKGSTVLVIAHRLSTIKDADRIVVLDQGHIAEQGTHNSLIEKQGLYYRLYTGSHSTDAAQAQGQAAQGQATQEQTAQGQAAQEQTAQGQAAQGQATQEQTAQGQAAV